MYIQDCGYYRSHHAETDDDPEIGTNECTDENTLAAFKMDLLTSLSRYQRADRYWTLAIDRYYSNSHARRSVGTVL